MAFGLASVPACADDDEGSTAGPTTVEQPFDYAAATERASALAVERGLDEVRFTTLNELVRNARCKESPTARIEADLTAQPNGVTTLEVVQWWLVFVEVLCPEHLGFYEGLERELIAEQGGGLPD